MNYWEEKGKHQKQWDKAWDKLVPQSGGADTMIGEAIRCTHRLYYECFNNGNGNAREEHGCGDDFEVSVNRFYKTRLDFLEDYGVPTSLCKDIKQIILNGQFDERGGAYDQVIDWIMENTMDFTPIEWSKNETFYYKK
jgi:hypothetical protein